MILHRTAAVTLADRLRELGNIAADRVRMDPAPGSVTFEDFEAAAGRGLRCEWIDDALVEKALSYRASVVAIAIAGLLRIYVRRNRLGLVSGAFFSSWFFQSPNPISMAAKP